MSANQKIDGKSNTQIAVKGSVHGDIRIERCTEVNGPYTIPCPNCENLVSNATMSCPHCGHPVAEHLRQQRVNIVERKLWGFVGVLGAILLALYFFSDFLPNTLQEYSSFIQAGILCVILLSLYIVWKAR